ncbi:MAG TPA: AAA family ATPase, partial [Steroidobacteraceae bacterium]|nr:AAA family ATPase [Steroidobacteraceae bacterium]
MNEPKLIVGFGRGSLAEISRSEAMSWSDLVDLLTTPPPETDDKSARGWFIPADFEEDYRDSENFKHRYALTLDYDHISRDDLAVIKATYDSYAHVLYTTWSHSGDRPRVRVVMPLSRPAQIDEFCAVSRKVAAMAGIELASRESHVPAQMMFLPTIKPGARFSSRKNTHGAWVDVDAVLATYENWTDRTSWPHRAEGDGTHKGDVQTPPSEKPGIVGAFCRAFDIPTAIQRFDLPYVPTAHPDRWTYLKGSRPEGAILYDHGEKLHSHHDTDPARGQTNAFDLVRLHRFAALDTVPAGTPITERPSYRAMCRLALEVPAVAAGYARAIGETEVEDLGPQPAADVLSDSKATVVEQKAALNQLPPPADGERLRFDVVTADVFAHSKKPAWLVKGVIPKHSVGVLYGASGAGKSFQALDIACAIQLGKPWRNCRVKKGRVVMIVAEGQTGHAQRLKAYSLHHNVDLASLPSVIEEVPNLLEVKDAADIARSIKAAGGADLIVIDTLAASFVGDENAGKDMQAVIRNAHRLGQLLGCAIWLIHHSGKDETKGARGHSSLKGAADHEELAHRDQTDPDLRVMRTTKQKDAVEGLVFYTRLHPVCIGKDEDGEDIFSCVCVEAEPPTVRAPTMSAGPQGPNQRAVWLAVKDSGGSASEERVLRIVQERGYLPPPGDDKRDRRHRAVKDALA